MLDGEFFGENERRARRYKIDAPAVLEFRGSPPVNVAVLNVGATGCRLRLTEPLRVASSVTLTVGGLPRLHALVCWSHKTAAGLAFDPPLAPGCFDRFLDY